MNHRHELVIDMYLSGKSNADILNTTGYKSKQSIYNILSKHAINERKKANRADINEDMVVQQWLQDISATTRTLGKLYGCSYATIRDILVAHLTQDEIYKIKCQKISYSTSMREDIYKPEFLAPARKAAVASGAASRNIRKAIIASAKKRKGKPLPEEQKQKMRGPRPHMQGENSSNWRGGISKYQWRKPNWREQREKTRERDNNTCQICGITAKEAGQNMDVHHIVSYHSFDKSEDANHLSNLICLCRTCHMRIENGILELPYLIKG